MAQSDKLIERIYINVERKNFVEELVEIVVVPEKTGDFLEVTDFRLEAILDKFYDCIRGPHYYPTVVAHKERTGGAGSCGFCFSPGL